MLIDRLMMTLVFFHCRASIFLCEVREFVGHCQWRPPFYQYCTCACIDRIIDGTLTVIFYGNILFFFGGGGGGGLKAEINGNIR